MAGSIITLTLAVTAAVVPAAVGKEAARSDREVAFPLPVSRLLDEGRARLECSALDIGEAGAITDGDPGTLARTAAANPAFVRLLLDEPAVVRHVRLVLSDDDHEVSISAADSAADLEARAGSFRWLARSIEVPRPGRLELDLPEPVTAYCFRLDVRRLTGDDYVHLFEWDLTNPAVPESIVIERLVSRRLASKGPEWREVEGPIVTRTPGVVVLRVQALGALGERVEVTPRASWRTAPGSVAITVPGTARVERTGDGPGEFLVEGRGTSRLVARLGGLECAVGLDARPIPIANRDPDVEVAFIERLPRLDFDGPHGGWPEIGARVVWRAHLKSWGDAPVRCRAVWRRDGLAVKEGKVTLGPSGLTEMTFLDLAAPWDGKRHDLELALEPLDRIHQVTEANDRLTVTTDALAVGFWVEASLWAHHHDHQRDLNDALDADERANSFAGWAQRGLAAWNAMLAAARFPEVPGGIRDRVRLDRLVIVPDFALPLAGGLASNNPDRTDKTVDLMWGFPACDLSSDWWSPVRAREQLAAGQREGAAFLIDFALFHELGHARYLIDGYGFDVHARSGPTGGPPNIRVADEQGSILGRYMPAEGIVHWRKHGGQMGGDYTRYGLYEALMLNRIAGRRARTGNQNAPADIGEYLQEIPERLVYRFTYASGAPLAHARVQVHRARPKTSDWYGKSFVDPPDFEKTTDETGRVVFDRTLFAADGRIVHGYGFSNGIVLLCVIHDGQRYFLFEEVTDANIAWALGRHDEAHFERRIERREGDPTPEAWRSR